jgi:hypothetical protein
VLDGQTLVWVGLNPSRSDDKVMRRPTLETVLHWAERAGLTRVLGVNLYTYRLTDSSAIKAALRDGSLGDLVGTGNDELLQHVAAQAEHVLLAWGSLGARGQRGQDVAHMFREADCVGTCKNGEPVHPARKSRSLTFRRYFLPQK